MFRSLKNRASKVFEACHRKTFLTLSMGLFFCSAVITIVGMLLPFMKDSSLDGPANLFLINWVRADIIFFSNIFILYFLSNLKIKGILASTFISIFVFLKEFNDSLEFVDSFIISYIHGIGSIVLLIACALAILALIFFIVSYFALGKRFNTSILEELSSTSLKSLFENFKKKISSLKKNYKYSFIGGILVLGSIFLPIRMRLANSNLAYLFMGVSSIASLVMAFFVGMLFKSILDDNKSRYYLFSSLTAFTVLFWALFENLFRGFKFGIGFGLYFVGIFLVSFFAIKEYRQNESVQ